MNECSSNESNKYERFLDDYLLNNEVTLFRFKYGNKNFYNQISSAYEIPIDVINCLIENLYDYLESILKEIHQTSHSVNIDIRHSVPDLIRGHIWSTNFSKGINLKNEKIEELRDNFLSALRSELLNFALTHFRWLSISCNKIPQQYKTHKYQEEK